MKKIISLFLTSLSFVALASEVQVKKSALFVPHTLGKVALTYNGNQFHVKQNNKKYPVQNYLVDPKLRNINAAQLKALQKVGYIAVNKTSDGEFTLKSNVRGLGGGALGATVGCWLGKAGVYLVSYGAIGIVSACTGPAAPVTFAALTTAWAFPIEAASQAGAIAGGILGAVATGPVREVK